MQNIHEQAQDVATTVAGSAAAAGWVTHIADANEILTLVATVIAIVTGCWVLWDKYQVRKERRNGESSKNVGDFVDNEGKPKK